MLGNTWFGAGKNNIATKQKKAGVAKIRTKIRLQTCREARNDKGFVPSFYDSQEFLWGKCSNLLERNAEPSINFCMG